MTNQSEFLKALRRIKATEKMDLKAIHNLRITCNGVKDGLKMMQIEMTKRRNDITNEFERILEDFLVMKERSFVANKRD